jgi:hypothetical protein
MIKVIKAVLMLVFISAAALMLLALAFRPATSSAVAEAAPAPVETQERESYWLRAFNGHISVFFSEEDEVPSVETTIDIDTLRAVDREKLEKGIEAPTYEDVLKLLEDFGS